MLLKDEEAQTQSGPHACHPFLYARVIGVYHANVVYTGPGNTDYNPVRYGFLWVRWYKDANEHHSPLRLHQLMFPPMAQEGSFGFVDPADVLRCCHIIPAFSRGNYEDLGGGVSKYARDSEDWRAYYVGQ